MKNPRDALHRIRAAVVTATLAGLAPAVPWAAEPPPATAPARAPRLEVERPEIDVGTVVRGQVVEASFELRNEGDADLRILSAKPG